MPFTGFYKTDLLGIPERTDFSGAHAAMIENMRNGAERTNLEMRLEDEKEGRAQQLKKAQQERADKMGKTSTFFPENQKEVSGLVQSSNDDVRNGYDISDKVNYAHHVASMDAIHKNDFDQNEAMVRDYHSNGIPQDTGGFEAHHAENKLKIHHTNANELNSQERADILNGKHYQADAHPELYHKSLEKSPFEDSVTKETPTSKTINDVSGQTAFPIDEPVTLPDGTQTVRTRAARTVDEMTKKDSGGNSYAGRFLSTDPMVANHWKEAAVRARQPQIVQATDEKVRAATEAGLIPTGSNGQAPEQFRKSAYEQSVADEAEKMAAERLLHTDMGNRKIKTTVEAKAPKTPPKMNHDERENTYDVHNMGADAKTYNTISKSEKGMANGKFLSHGGVVIKNKNNKKPVLTLNEQTVKNESTGGYENLTEGSDAVLDNVRAVYSETGKDGTRKVNIPTQFKSPLDYIKSLTPKQVVERDIKSDPTAYLTVAKAGGVGDTGLSPYEAQKYATLKQKFSKKVPKPDSPEYKEYEEMRGLEAVKDQKEKTFSLPYRKIEGQLGQLIGNHNATPDALMSRLDPRDHAEYLEGKRILEQKRREYEKGTKTAPPQEKLKELRSKYNY